MAAFVDKLNLTQPGEPVVLAPLLARTVTGNAPGIAVGERSTVRLDLVCTAASGTTPSCTVSIDTSPDNVTWVSMSSTFTAFTGATTQRKCASSLDRFVRVSWVITGGTPSLTFSVSGELV